MLGQGGGGWREPEVSELNTDHFAPSHSSPMVPFPTHPHTQLRNEPLADSLGTQGEKPGGYVAQGTWPCSHLVRILFPSFGNSLPSPTHPTKGFPDLQAEGSALDQRSAVYILWAKSRQVRFVNSFIGTQPCPCVYALSCC